MSINRKYFCELWLFAFGILATAGLAFYAAWLLAGAVTAGPVDAEGLLFEPKGTRVVGACLLLFFELPAIAALAVVLLRLRRRFRWRIGVVALTVTVVLGMALAFAGAGGYGYCKATGHWRELSDCVREAGSVAELEHRFGPAKYHYPVIDDRNLDWVIDVANFYDREFAKDKEVYFFAASSLPCYWIVIWCEDGKIVKKTWSPM